MAVAITKICDPEVFRLDDAIQKAKSNAAITPGFELHIVRFLQSQCLSSRVPLPIVFRGLEVLGGMVSGAADEGRLITLLRPFLKSSDPQVVSKCVLVMGRQSRNLSWLNGIMGETDERIRANLIESLWQRKEPEVETVLRGAVDDSHARVVANAVYGLYLLGVDDWTAGLERLVGSAMPAFRISGIWVLKSSGVGDAPTRIKHLIQDQDADVRRAAFGALKHLREHASRPVAPAKT